MKNEGVQRTVILCEKGHIDTCWGVEVTVGWFGINTANDHLYPYWVALKWPWFRIRLQVSTISWYWSIHHILCRWRKCSVDIVQKLYAGYTLKDFCQNVRDHTRGQKNPRFNHFAPIVCGVQRCDKDSTPRTNRFSTKSPDCEHGKSRKISGDLRVNKIYLFLFQI